MATQIDKVYSLNIGVQGENIARAIELDMTAWVEAYPDASFHVLFKPYNESEAVPMVSSFEDNILTWTPTLSATAVSGVGYTEIRALDSDTGLIRKSRIIPTSVENSVSGTEADPPAPYQDWVNRILKVGVDAVSGAAAVAAVAQGEAVAFEINEGGHLVIAYTEGGEQRETDLGPVDAYAIAVVEGYTGTREEWVQALADAEANGLKAEGYAVGKQNGVAVESGEYYQNNAKYYNEQAQSAKEDAETAKTAAEAAQASATASAAEAAQYTSDAVHTWLENSIDPATGYALDRTLAEPLAAAPADMVGDLKSALSVETVNLLEILHGSLTQPTGMTITNNGDGTFVVNGTNNTGGYAAIAVSEQITLAAGSYTFGFIPSQTGQLQLQIRDYTGGSDGGDLANATAANRTFTISSEKIAVLRLLISNGKSFSNFKVSPIITKSTDFPVRFVPNVTAKDVEARNTLENAFTNVAPPSSNDFDDCENGITLLSSTTAYAHSPIGNKKTASHVMTYEATNLTGENKYRIQYFFTDSSENAEVYRRSRVSGIWSEWLEVYDLQSMLNADFCINQTGNFYIPTKTITSVVNVDVAINSDRSLTINGTSTGTGARIISELFELPAGTYRFGTIPAMTGAGTQLQIRDYTGGSDGGDLAEPTANYRDFTISSTKKAVLRLYTASGKTYSYMQVCPVVCLSSDWPTRYVPNISAVDFVARKDVADINDEIDSMERTVSGSFVPSSVARQDESGNVGEKIRVMSYNICNFNNDWPSGTAGYNIPSDKLFNLRKLFGIINADIAMVQEDSSTLSLSGTAYSSDNYFYYPLYPFRYGDSGTTIHSKVEYAQGAMVAYSNGRTLRYNVYNMQNDKKLLVISTHPIAHDAEARAVQYDELFKWIKGIIPLDSAISGNPVNVPEFTHCVIGMDGNSETAGDKTLLETLASGSNCVLGNGGYLGWFVTCMRDGLFCLDNIIVTDNIIINSIEAYNDWYNKTYSDHVPVVADLTLLDKEWIIPNS